MNVESAYFFQNASILLTRPVEFGDLLSAINKMKQVQLNLKSFLLGLVVLLIFFFFSLSETSHVPTDSNVLYRRNFNNFRNSSLL